LTSYSPSHTVVAGVVVGSGDAFPSLPAEESDRLCPEP
jgi:hypothetical protein